MKKKMVILLMILVVLIPYKILFQDYANTIVCLFSTLYVTLFIKEIKENKVYTYGLCGLVALAIISLCFTNGMVDSMEGVTLYIGALWFYLILANNNEHKNSIINALVYGICGGALFYIIFQGAIYKGGILKNRIDGNIGYANTYGLIMLVALYLNEIRKSKSFSDIIQMILVVGILFTGSRNTLLYLLVFYIIKISIDIKNKKDLSCIFNFFISVIIYSAIEKMGFKIVIILPLILLILNSIVKHIPVKIKNYGAILMMFLIIPGTLLLSTTFATRIKGMSLQSNELQQRLVYFKDAIYHIKNYPLGSGINTFIYRQGLDQSAFYDVRYIHNSILQVGYDIGIIGMILFVFIAIYGAVIIYKSKNKNKIYYLALYITIYLHSLLDFDFAYLITFVILVMIIAFMEESEEDKKVKKTMQVSSKKLNIKLTALSIIVLIFTFYLVLVGSVNIIGNQFGNEGKYSEARSMYSINKNITFNNYSIYFKIADTYNKEGKKTGNKELIEKAIENLKIAESINPKESRVIGNLAFSYEALGRDKETMEYYEKFLHLQSFFYDMYKNYYKYLNKQYSETKEQVYKVKMEELEKSYRDNLKKLTPDINEHFGEMPQSIR